MEYMQTIAKLESTISDLTYMLQRADLEIKRHAEIDCEI